MLLASTVPKLVLMRASSLTPEKSTRRYCLIRRDAALNIADSNLAK